MNSVRTADRTRTPRNLWGRLIALLVPVTILGVTLKLLRIHAFFPTAGIAETAVKVSSDVTFGGAWVLVWTLGCLYTHRRVRTITFYTAHAATAFVGLFAVLNHYYVLHTGNPLSWPTLIGAARQREELEALISSQIDAPLIGLLIGVVAGVGVLPLPVLPHTSKALTAMERFEQRHSTAHNPGSTTSCLVTS